MYRRIVVGLDGSDGARRALDAAIALARVCKSELFLVSIVELPKYPGAIDEIEDERRTAEEFYREMQRQAVERVTSAGLAVHADVRVGHPAQSLPAYAGEVKADLLALGHSGHSGIWGRVLGTTADKVVDLAPCSVLVVR
ncbi:MAG: universal stress protein [Deltaproteobacteria bacterium]|nr:universal stress protein [Deltaproteobacteria bacterium]